MNQPTTPADSTDAARPLTPDEIRAALASIETGMRMLSKAIHRFHELQAVHNELRYDVQWTNYLVQLRQSIEKVSQAVKPGK